MAARSGQKAQDWEKEAQLRFYCPSLNPAYISKTLQNLYILSEITLFIPATITINIDYVSKEMIT